MPKLTNQSSSLAFQLPSVTLQPPSNCRPLPSNRHPTAVGYPPTAIQLQCVTLQPPPTAVGNPPEVVWAVIVSRHEDGHVGKLRQAAFTAVQKAETTLRGTQPQQQPWQSGRARATNAKGQVQWRFSPKWRPILVNFGAPRRPILVNLGLHNMGPVIKGSHGVQRMPRDAGPLGDIYRPSLLAGLLSRSSPV